MSLSRVSSLVLVGAGKMGGAMLIRWLELGLKGAAVTLVDPMLAPEMADLAAKHGMRVLTDAADIPSGPDVLVIAVKPQTMDKVLPKLAPKITADSVVISIAAGKRIATFEAAFGAAAIVRVMPNTPAMVGAGMSVGVANSHVSPAQRALVGELMDAVGKTAFVDDENQIDAVTGLSGSGPAYIFLMVEALTAAGRAAGLPDDLAGMLARQTVVGGGALLAASPDDAATLRKNVTSPAGTTAAALAVLMADDGLEPLMVKAVAAATNRSRELAG